jgi:hypothetical protein
MRLKRPHSYCAGMAGVYFCPILCNDNQSNLLFLVSILVSIFSWLGRLEKRQNLRELIFYPIQARFYLGKSLSGFTYFLFDLLRDTSLIDDQPLYHGQFIGKIL